MLDLFRLWHHWRDRIVMTAHRAGLSTSEISARTGLARSTVYRIISKKTPADPMQVIPRGDTL